jgi:hypothetical protein
MYHKLVYAAIIFQLLYEQLLLDSQSDSVSRAGVPGSRTVLYGGCYLHKPRDCVIEKLLITFAEITFPAAVLSIQTNSVFHTSAATYIKVAAEKALVTKILLLAGKCPFCTTGGELL